jgi:hypothetical protein
VGIFDASSRVLLVSGVVPVMPGSGASSFDPFVGLTTDPVLAAGMVLNGKSLTGAASPASLVFPDTDENSFAGFYGPNFAEVPAPLPLAGAATALSWSRRLRRRLRQGSSSSLNAPWPCR